VKGIICFILESGMDDIVAV